MPRLPLRFAMVAAVALNWAEPAMAQAWPTQPITMVVPFAAGGVCCCCWACGRVGNASSRCPQIHRLTRARRIAACATCLARGKNLPLHEIEQSVCYVTGVFDALAKGTSWAALTQIVIFCKANYTLDQSPTGAPRCPIFEGQIPRLSHH
jgi:hypothetical protein